MPKLPMNKRSPTGHRSLKQSRARPKATKKDNEIKAAHARARYKAEKEGKAVKGKDVSMKPGSGGKAPTASNSRLKSSSKNRAHGKSKGQARKKGRSYT